MTTGMTGVAETGTIVKEIPHPQPDVLPAQRSKEARNKDLCAASFLDCSCGMHLGVPSPLHVSQDLRQGKVTICAAVKFSQQRGQLLNNGRRYVCRLIEYLTQGLDAPVLLERVCSQVRSSIPQARPGIRGSGGSKDRHSQSGVVQDHSQDSAVLGGRPGCRFGL
jgi:hypothetical protein